MLVLKEDNFITTLTLICLYTNFLAKLNDWNTITQLKHDFCIKNQRSQYSSVKNRASKIKNKIF